MSRLVQLIALLAVAAMLSPAARADVITIRADEWCPYNCAADADRPGYGIEIAREILAKAGHSIDYRTMAWPRAIEECRRGNVVAIIGATKEDAPDFVFPASPIGESDNTYVVKKGAAWSYAGTASLGTVKLGIIQGYAYSGKLDDYLKQHGRDRARVDAVGGDNALEQNLRKLLAGRIDVLVDTRAVLSYKIGDMKLADQVAMVGSDDPASIYIAFSPANPKARDYAALVDAGIAELRASGRLKAILDRYGMTDWK